MALSGNFDGTFSGVPSTNRKPRLYWSATQSVAGNYSDVTLTLYFWLLSDTYWSYNLNEGGASAHWNTGNINGTTSYTYTPYDTRSQSGNVFIRTITVRVYHNTDGTKTCWLGWSGDTNTSMGTYNFGQTVTLTTIPRRATISTASANLTIGNNLAYTLVNNGSLYVRMEYWMYGNAGWYRVKNQNNGTGTSGTFTMDATDNNNMYSRLPSTLSCSAIMRAYTYSDSGYSTQIGDYHDVTGTLSINQTTNKPTFTTYTVENVDKTVDNVDKYSNTLVSSSTATLLDSSTKLIKGYSKARAVITSANKMVAQNYATGVKYRFVIGSSYDEENYSAGDTVNLDIDNISTGATSVTAYDSRGLTTTVSQTVSGVANYSAVSLWGLELVRDNGVDSATKLQVSGEYWNEYFGGGTDGVQNTITAHWRYKLTTESWSTQTWTAITLTDTDGVLSYDDYIEGDLGATGFDEEKSFDIEVRVYDKLTNYIIEETLNVGTPVIDITSNGIAIKQRYDSDVGGSLQVDGAKWIPTGVVLPFADSTAPSGYLICDGSAISRTDYADLYDVIGTTYGVGDGSTTFNIPDLKGKVPVGYNSSDTSFDAMGETGGAKDVTLTSAQSGLVAHSHTNTAHDHTQDSHYHGVRYKQFTGISAGTGWYLLRRRDGADGYDGEDADATSTVTANNQTSSITIANSSSASATSSHTNLQPYITLAYIIKT